MQTIHIQPVEFTGQCPAGLQPEDEFLIQGMSLKNPQGRKICFLAVSQLAPTIIQLQGESRFFSHAPCPGCTSQHEAGPLAQENQVTFLLGHAEKWDLCKAISEYRRLSQQVVEPEQAVIYKTEAVRLQSQGEWGEAEKKIKAAFQELKRVSKI
jgi:hypothetical protein